MAAGMKQKALAATLNRPLSWVRARLAIVALPVEAQDAIDTGVYEPSDALTFAKYADRPDVIATILHDGIRHAQDLDWRLERAAAASDLAAEYAQVTARCREAGWTVHESRGPADTPPHARRLSELGVDDDAHAAEACHVVSVTRYAGEVSVALWCSAPTRHTTRGDSDVKSTARPTNTAVNDGERVAREPARAVRAANAHRAAFARDAIIAKLRSRDLLEFVLPVLFDTAGQTELKAAAKLLGIDPVEAAHGYKDHAGPLRDWAAQSTANTTRAMLAVAYSVAAEAGEWRPIARQRCRTGSPGSATTPNRPPEQSPLVGRQTWVLPANQGGQCSTHPIGRRS